MRKRCIKKQAHRVITSLYTDVQAVPIFPISGLSGILPQLKLIQDEFLDPSGPVSWSHAGPLFRSQRTPKPKNGQHYRFTSAQTTNLAESMSTRDISSEMKAIRIEITPRLERLPAPIANNEVNECDEWKLRIEMPL